MSDNKRVVVGLSGGVDSSVVAALLLEQGYEVHGVYLECYNTPGCRTDQDKKDALKVALKLGISFEVLDFREEYKEKVIEYFYREYEAERTPNPDVMCNREIKFGIFYDYAMENGFDYVATGHYARIATYKESPRRDLQGDSFKLSFKLQCARDESKDQSYFLWQIPRDHLAHILFPLGEMDKSEVRVKAKKLGLGTADKPDSMGICFMGEVNVSKLLEDRLGEKKGDVVMYPAGPGPAGHKIGEHRGLWFYTIGQRGGWEMDPKSQISNSLPAQAGQILKLGIDISNMPPLYVVGKDKKLNRLIVGKREECYRNQFIVNSSWLMAEKKQTLWVRVRNLGELVEVSSWRMVHGTWQVKTAKPIFALAEGQSAVFYDENGIMVGGGIIGACNIHKNVS